jgi:hypothetical protein
MPAPIRGTGNASDDRPEARVEIVAVRSRILHVMTRALDTAIAKLSRLPADEQDRIALWVLEELRDEEHWAGQFAGSQNALSKLAAEARAERAAGKATDLDPDKL